jgi:hypothetical protein
MSSIAKTSISLSKKDLTKSKNTLIASRNIVFYHKATKGQTTINLNSLSMPSEMPTQVQATADEISGARLSIFKKNLKLVSSSNGELIQGLDYLVVDSYTISLIGPYITTSGAEASEIFVGTVVGSPMSDLTVVSTQNVIKTYTLAIGQNILNLAQEYQIGVNPLENIGSMKIWVNGVLAIRSSDYIEVDGGTGFGSTIQFLSSPTSTPWQIVVDFGVRAITDTNAMGTIESLSGSILKIATDLADVAGTSATDYLTANPSEIERRTYGDSVLSLLSRVSALESAIAAQPLTIMYRSTVGQSIANNSVALMSYETQEYSNAPAGSVVSGSGAFSFTVPAGYAGTYDISASFGLAVGLASTPVQTYIYILKNGSSVRETGQNVTQGGAAVFPTIGVSAPVRLAVGDTITIQAYQQSGATRTTSTIGADNYVTLIKRSN